MDNNKITNSLNNIQQASISQHSELTEQITTEEAQYRYLQELNKKLTLFKKNDEQSEKMDEETEQTMRR